MILQAKGMLEGDVEMAEISEFYSERLFGRGKYERGRKERREGLSRG